MEKIKRNKKIVNKYRFHLAVAICLVIFVFLSHVPYINLVPVYFTGILFWLAVMTWIGFNGMNLIRLGVLLFAVLCLFILLNEVSIAENFGNATFLILLTGVILLIRDNLKEQ